MKLIVENLPLTFISIKIYVDHPKSIFFFLIKFNSLISEKKTKTLNLTELIDDLEMFKPKIKRGSVRFNN